MMSCPSEDKFSYDRFGNRLISSSNVAGVPNPGFKINGANNRLIAPTDTDGTQAPYGQRIPP
jgi:hypothetical protein